MYKHFINEEEVFAVNDELSVTVETIESLNRKIVIVDNFYKNPEQVRDLALRIPPSFNERIRTRLPAPRVNAFYLMDHMGHIFDKIIRDVWPEYSDQIPVNHFFDVFRDATFVVNVMNDKFLEPRPPHIDYPDPRCFAAMIYLNTPEECQGGTGFYTFNGEDCGTEYGKSVSDNGTPTDEYIIGDMGDWKLQYMSEMKWNRMVLYQANIYHSAHVAKGMYSGDLYRLNQMFFI